MLSRFSRFSLQKLEVRSNGVPDVYWCLKLGLRIAADKV